jgi:hypothetical protein
MELIRANNSVLRTRYRAPETPGVRHNETINMGSHTMKSMIVVIVILVGATVMAQQTNTLDMYRQLYDRQEQSILTQYGKTLNSVMADLKKRGDLDNVLILQTEKKRFDTDKSVPSPTDAKDSFRPATEAYCQAMVALMDKYVIALDGLIRQEVVADRIEQAKVVKTEKDTIAFMLAELQTRLPVKAAAAKPKTEAPANAMSSQSVFRPKTYTDETRGFAGGRETHNVYTFNLDAVGRKATLRFWASGDKGTSTFGTVSVTPPEQKEAIIVYKWQPEDFKVAADSVSSYVKLKAITCDISRLVKEPGPYDVTFKWTNGKLGLSILRVELEVK